MSQAADSSAGTTTIAYDALDHVTSVTSPQGTVSYTSDAIGRRQTMTVSGQPQISYSYDAGNRLTQITQNASNVQFGYDSLGRRTSMTLPNGVLANYAYDAASQLTGITYSKASLAIGDLQYSYDGAGRRTSVTGSLARTILRAFRSCWWLFLISVRQNHARPSQCALTRVCAYCCAYKANAQRAARDGDWKFLKILNNTFLFNVVEDPMERGNLKERQKEIYERIAREWLAWNATMLPEIDESFTGSFTGGQLADHIGSPRATTRADNPSPSEIPPD